MAKEDGYIPGWDRTMVVVVVAVAVPGHSAGHSRHSSLHSVLHSKKKCAQEGDCPLCALSIVWCLVGVFGDCLEK